jgi:RNA polymerase sigma-70 factor (sigma-E family)
MKVLGSATLAASHASIRAENVTLTRIVKTAEERAVRGHEGYLGDLYEAHALKAFRFAYMLTGTREVAEDLVQEAFLRAFDQLMALRKPEAFPGYLRTTILNAARGHFRRQRIERLSLRRIALLDRSAPTPPPDVGEREHLWRALQRLPYRQRAAIVLRYYEDLSERDAARALETSVPAIKALVSRGTKTLRAELQTEGG